MPTMTRPRRPRTPPKRTVWHALFAALVLERRPRGFDVLVDVPLSLEPQRADLLLLRKRRAGGRPPRRAVLRGLWPKLGSDTLVEFKSAARPLRRGDLVRLLGYGAQYHARHAARLDRRELSLVLVVPGRSRVLDDELGRLGWRLGAGAGGYRPIEGGPYPGWVVFLDDVRQVEGDRVLAPFVGATMELAGEALRWWQRQVGAVGGKAMANVAKLEGYDELLGELVLRLPRRTLERVAARLPAQVVATLPADKRLAGLSLEERLAGLSAEEIEAFVARHKRTPKAGAKAKPRRRKTTE